MKITHQQRWQSSVDIKLLSPFDPNSLHTYTQSNATRSLAAQTAESKAKITAGLWSNVNRLKPTAAASKCQKQDPHKKWRN